ncbi:MAG: GAF domain-containing protein [Bacteroidales bacterium]|nr:GAF domain-containing protein [Bacteroidales bacterium]
MKTSRIYKTLAFLAIIAELIIFFVLFGKIRNLLLDYNISENQQLIYVLLILAVIIVVFLFILSILTSHEKISEEKYIKKDTNLLDENSKQKEVAKKQDDEELIDIENYIKKILPKENSKLDLEKYTEKLLSNIAKEFDVVQGLFFVKEKESDIFNIAGKYAYFGDEEPKSFSLSETLSGQVAKNKTTLNLKEIPENYVTILSGLGSSSPNHLIIIPIILEDKTIAIVELASFKEFKRNFSDLLEGMSDQIGKALMKY